MRFEGFIGPSYQLQSLRWDLQRSVNLYLQVDESGSGKVPVALVGTPGLRRWGTLPYGPVRGMWPGGAPLTTGARLFVVGGSRFYEVGGAITDATPGAISIGNGHFAVDRGDIGDDAAHSPVLIFSNGDDLFIVSAGYAYVDRGGVPGDVGAGPQRVRLTITLTGLMIDAVDDTKLVSLSTPFTVEDAGKFLDITGGDGFTIQNGLSILAVEPDVRFQIYAYTDLAIDALDTTRCSSVARPFTQDDVGKFLDVTAGAGFTVQTVKILRVLPNTITFIANFTDLWIDPSDNTKLGSDSNPFAAGDIGSSLTITGEGRHPIAMLTDLVIDASDDTKVSSLSRPFSQDDVGNWLDITAGVGFTPQEVQISAVSDVRVDVNAYADLAIDASDPFKMTSAARPFSAADIGKRLDVIGGGTYETDGFTDLAIDSMNAHLLSSSAFGGFGAEHIGSTLQITGGIGFNVGALTIVALGSDPGTVIVNMQAGDLGATGGTGRDPLAPVYNYDGFTVQTVIIAEVDGAGVATADKALGVCGATAGTGNEYYGTPVATVDKSLGALGSVDGVGILRAPGGFTLQTVKILDVDTGVAIVDRPLGEVGSKAGTGTQWGLKTIAVVDAPLGTAGSTGGTATEWFQTGIATVSDSLGAPASSGGTGIQWEYLRASSGAYLDGYFIASWPDSRKFYISPLEDSPDRNPLMWDRLDYSEKQAYPDNIVSILADREQLYLLGDTTIEIWRNTGASPFPFQRYPDALIPQGCRANTSPVALANSIAWVGGDNRGGPIAWRARGYVPERISTHAVEQAWGSYTNIADAQTYVYVEEGHQFWVISFPSANRTWVYDATASDQLGKHIWHERASVSIFGLGRHRSRCHAFVYGKHLVGDWMSGKILEMSLALGDDEGNPIQRQRVAPHISNEELRIFYPRLQLDLGEVGTNAAFVLDWSDNGGKTWSNQHTRSSGAAGDGNARVLWNRIGSARSRVFRMTSTAAVSHVWLGVYLLPPVPGTS